jgi:type IX secretion system PorP/SprF family membrane protein
LKNKFTYQKIEVLRKHKYSCVVSFILWLLICTSTIAQDIHFSQFFEAPLLRNPSLAGIFTGDIRMQTVHRSQWNSVSVPYETTSMNAETKIKVGDRNDDFVTVGAQLMYDKAGTTNFKSVHALPVLNYHKSLSAEKNRYLSLGFMGGYINRTIDRSKITTNNQWGSGGFDANLPIGENFTNANYHYWDASVGTTYSSNIGETDENNFFIGVGYHHFTNPKVGFYESSKQKLHPKIVASAGLKYHFGEDSYITIQADHSNQENYNETIGGLLYSMNFVNGIRETQYTLHAGAFLRWKDALIPVIKFDYSPFSISFSYDANISQLKTASKGRGGYEVSISYIAFKPNRSYESDAVRCPKF